MAVSKATASIIEFATAPGEPRSDIVQDSYGETELMRTTSAEQVVELLLLMPEGARRTAYLGIRDKHGRTALAHAANAGRLEVVELLVAMTLPGYRAGYLKMKDRYGHTPLMLAARQGHFDITLALLAMTPEGSSRTDYVKMKDNTGKTVLAHAAVSGCVATVHALLAFGKVKDMKDNSGKTPLIHASSLGHLDVVRTLLAAWPVGSARMNAVNARDREGCTALMYAANGGFVGVALTLVLAIADGTNLRYSMNVKDSRGRTALMHAAEGGHGEVVEALVGAASDVAEGRERWEVMRWLLQAKENFVELKNQLNMSVDPTRNMDHNEDEELERMYQRSLRLGTSIDGLRRRPLHPGVEYDEDSDDEENLEKKLIKETCKEELLEETKSSSAWISFFLVFIIVATCALSAKLVISYQYRGMASFEPDLVDQYQKGIAPYRRQFPSQSNELWGNVFSGIQLTSTSNRLSVFLIIHDETTNTSCLAQALGRVSANLLSNASQPLVVPASDLDPSETFREDLSARRAIVVEELQKMPAGQNQKLLLHGLADSVNPIVPGIAVVLTLQVHEEGIKNALRAAELELDRVWNWIDSESRLPLIVRVTSGFVYKMASEKNVIKC